MSVRLQVLEYTRCPIKDGVIEGVKIIGTQSKNGRRYPMEVLRAAKPLYEGSPVYMFHPDEREKRKGSRQLVDHFGTLMNIREQGDQRVPGSLGLFGDLHIKQSHPYASLVLENLDKPFGLSHNAICELNDEQTEVLEIVSVNSVDLVDNPGTTTTLFEETEMTLEEYREENKAFGARMDKLEENIEKMTTVLEAHEKSAEPPPKKRLAVLEDAPPEEGEAVPIGNNHGAFLDVLLGFSTIDTKGAQA